MKTYNCLWPGISRIFKFCLISIFLTISVPCYAIEEEDDLLLTLVPIIAASAKHKSTNQINTEKLAGRWYFNRPWDEGVFEEFYRLDKNTVYKIDNSNDYGILGESHGSSNFSYKWNDIAGSWNSSTNYFIIDYWDPNYEVASIYFFNATVGTFGVTHYYYNILTDSILPIGSPATGKRLSNSYKSLQASTEKASSRHHFLYQDYLNAQRKATSTSTRTKPPSLPKHIPSIQQLKQLPNSEN